METENKNVTTSAESSNSDQEREAEILSLGAPGVKSKAHPDIAQQLSRVPIAALGIVLLLIMGFAAWGYLAPKGTIRMGGENNTEQKPQPAKAPAMATAIPEGVSIPASFGITNAPVNSLEANNNALNTPNGLNATSSNTTLANAESQTDYQAQARMQLEMQHEQEAAQRRQEAIQQAQAREARLASIRSADSTVFSSMNDQHASTGTAPGADIQPAFNGENGPLQGRLSTSNASAYLTHTRMPAISPYELKAGAVIPSVMLSGINSDLPGEIIAQVVQNVYDSATGHYLLIPQGARLVGSYDHSLVIGQQRVLVAWNRIIYPDSSSVDIETMAGQDQSGYAGFKDKVNAHSWAGVKQALLLSAISAGAQLSQPRTQQGDYSYSAPQIGAAALGQQLNQLGMGSYQFRSNQSPTITIRPGYRFNVMVNKDMVLAPWQENAATPYPQTIYQTAFKR